MHPLLGEKPKNFCRSKFLLGLSASILIGIGTTSAKSISFQIQSSESDATAGDNDAFDAATGAAQFFLGTTGSESVPEFLAAQQTNNIGFALPSSDSLRLFGHRTQTISSAPGSTVTLDLQTFALRGHSTLTLLGDTTSTFIINVTKQFSLAGNAKVVLSGGLQWNQVFFNVLGTGTTVSLGGKSILFGTLIANQRTVKLNGHASVYGAVFARQLVVHQAAQITAPPVVSQ
jgi:Ice-binding-like